MVCLWCNHTRNLANTSPCAGHGVHLDRLTPDWNAWFQHLIVPLHRESFGDRFHCLYLNGSVIYYSYCNHFCRNTDQVNTMIQKAANLRVGQGKARVVTACRNAIKSFGFSVALRARIQMICVCETFADSPEAKMDTFLDPFRGLSSAVSTSHVLTRHPLLLPYLLNSTWLLFGHVSQKVDTFQRFRREW